MSPVVPYPMPPATGPVWSRHPHESILVDNLLPYRRAHLRPCAGRSGGKFTPSPAFDECVESFYLRWEVGNVDLEKRTGSITESTPPAQESK